MIRNTWIRRAMLGTYVMLITLVLAHSINAFVAHSLSALRDSTLPVTAPHTPSPKTYDAKALAESILAARLFLVPAGTGSLSAGGEGTSPPPPPLNVGKKILLLGTAVNSSTGEFAILENLSSKKQTLYRLLETVPAVGMIAQIEKDRVLFRQGSQEEWLNLAIENLSPGFERTLTASAHPASSRTASLPAALPVLPVSSRGRNPIQRQILIETAKDTSRLYEDARLVPMVVNGRSEGIRMEAINHYSIYGQLGFEPDDVLKRINGVELRDPAMFASIFQHLKDERTIKIDILRKDQPKTLAIDVL